jgi:putative ATP-dependent endonuclease of OLD family
VHRLDHIEISNFRSCYQVSLPLDDFTPIVGYNNAGKSNILAAIEWFLEASALSANDFNDPQKRLSVTGSISGVSIALLDLMPANQRTSIKPYVQGELLRLRRAMPQPGAAATAKLEVRDPSISDENDQAAWVAIPTGIPQAIKVLLPEVIRVRAMENASDDVGKASKSNTIGKLIAEIIEPIRNEHEADLRAALDQIGSRLSADGSQRAEKLNEFDAGASAQLADLFPGLTIKLDVPLPDIPDLFKNGTVRILELQGGNLASRTFDSVGHGAQRCIQMALIRYLAETKAAMQIGKRALLLIDEPELYLHPQGVEQVRQAPAVVRGILRKDSPRCENWSCLRWGFL